MVNTRRMVRPEVVEPRDEGTNNQIDPVQIILDRLEQQQHVIDEIRATQARQDQERDSVIATAIADVVARLQQSEKEVVSQTVQRY